MVKTIRPLLLLTLFLCVTLIFGASAVFAEQNGKTYSYTASDKQLKQIKELMDKPITKGEFLQIVFPEALGGMTEALVKELYKTNVVWPDLNTARTAPQQEKTNNNVGIQAVYSVGSESNLGVTSGDPNRIDFDSGSRVWLPTPFTKIPFMDVTSYLYKNENLTAFVYDYGENVYQVSAAGKWPVTSSGTFEVVGIHAGIFPPDTIPPGYSATTYDGPTYVTP